MILTRDILFIHIPKTAGVSCTDFLCRNLRQPIAYFSIQASFGKKKYKSAQIFPGFNHETLEEAYSAREKILDLCGIDVNLVEKVLTVVRHPYDLEASIYNFFRNAHRNALQHLSDSPNLVDRIELAKGSFKEFVAGSGYFRQDNMSPDPQQLYRVEDYFLVDGQVPPNVHILKFEDIGETLPNAVRPYLSPEFSGGFPHLNPSNGKRKKPVTEMDDEVKALIYEKHRWLFDHGYYQP